MARPIGTDRVKKVLKTTGVKRDWKIADTVRVVYEGGPILDPEKDYPKGSEQPFSITRTTTTTDGEGEQTVENDSEVMGYMRVTESDTHGAKGVVVSVGKSNKSKK